MCEEVPHAECARRLWLCSDDEEVRAEPKPEKKRVEVLWNDLKFEFVWRIGTPTNLLVIRLARMLDPLADARRLLLFHQDGLQAMLDDYIENESSISAVFHDSALASHAPSAKISFRSAPLAGLPSSGHQEVLGSRTHQDAQSSQVLLPGPPSPVRAARCLSNACLRCVSVCPMNSHLATCFCASACLVLHTNASALPDAHSSLICV